MMLTPHVFMSLKTDKEKTLNIYEKMHFKISSGRQVEKDSKIIYEIILFIKPLGEKGRA